MASRGDTVAAPEKSLWQRCLAVGIGNFMEWFDFATFGFFAGVIGREFFVGGSAAVSVLSALAVFAVGFFMRPLGGIILGTVGDRYGRRTALTASIVAMGLATTLLGCLPNYNTIGVLAPVLLVFGRCLQGLSAGGEYTGAASFLLEAVPARRRGLYTSVIVGTSGLATMTGSITALTLTSILSPADLASFGWRIPFLCALPLAAIGLFIRLRLEDTPVFKVVNRRRDATARGNVGTARRNAIKPMMLTLAMASVGTVGYYYLSSFVSNFLQTTVKMSPTRAFVVTGLGLFIYMCMTPVAGHLSDRYGRRPINLIGTCGSMVVIVPMFYLLRTGDLPLCVLGVGMYAVCQSFAITSLTVMLVELFPASARMSGSSIGYNVGQALFGGPGPFIGSWLALTFASAIAPAFYVVVLAFVAFIVLFLWLPETGQRDIESDEGIQWGRAAKNLATLPAENSSTLNVA